MKIYQNTLTAMLLALLVLLANSVLLKGQNETPTKTDQISAVSTNETASKFVSGVGYPEIGNSDTIKSFDWEPEMVFIKGGSFMMGSEEDNDEKPPHIVVVNDFYMGKYEITQAQWQAVMGSNPSYNKGCDNCPVEQVSWNDVQEFITKLNQKTGKSYYLPTEAEWEYAAGGGKAHQKWAGTKNESTLERYAWIESNSGGKTNPVGKRSPNLFGLYDMTGNVWEWCADWRKGYPGSSGVTDYTNAGRVIRGGGWYIVPHEGRVAYRNSYAPDGRHNLGIGFRLVLVP